MLKDAILIALDRGADPSLYGPDGCNALDCLSEGLSGTNENRTLGAQGFVVMHRFLDCAPPVLPHALSMQEVIRAWEKKGFPCPEREEMLDRLKAEKASSALQDITPDSKASPGLRRI